MGVRANLIAAAPNNASIVQAEKLGIDVPGNLSGLELKCSEMIQMLNTLASDVSTPSGDTTFGTVISTAITALS